MDTRSTDQHLNHLSEIRSLMERSSRFISLSGLSGVLAGTIALFGAFAMYLYMGSSSFLEYDGSSKWGIGFKTFVVLDAALVLILAIVSGIIPTLRRADVKGEILFSKTSFRLMLNLFIPLASGGIFCLILMYHGLLGLVAPATLLFYGLALVNGSKYTLETIRYLGYIEIILGLISAIWLGYGLIFWAIGFGVMHIVYGTFMYFRYERE